MPLDTSRVSKIRYQIKTLVETHFASTLGRETDIVNVFSALICFESRYNVNAVGKSVSANKGTAGYQYLNSSAVSAVLNSGNPTLIANAFQGITAIGLTQVMGWNFIRGGSLSGRSEIERLRPDLALGLVVEPGTDLYAAFLGEANINKVILAGLIILEGKYRATQKIGDSWQVNGDPYTRKFYDRISGAVAAYLGLGRADANGTTPEAYAASIVGGSMYKVANSGSVKISDSQVKVASSNGPTTNGSGLGTVKQAGC